MTRTALCAFLAAALALPAAGAQAPRVSTWYTCVPADSAGGYVFEARAWNLTDEPAGYDFAFELTRPRSGAPGAGPPTRQRQAGYVALGGSQVRSLGRVTISAQPGDSVAVAVVLTDPAGDTVAAQSATSTFAALGKTDHAPPAAAEADAESPDAPSGESGSEINGLILDETRTKAGADFYDAFYAKWQAPPGARDFAITLEEYPVRGRVARLAVKVDDAVVLRPVLQPRQALVELSAERAVRAVQQYLTEQTRLRQQLENEDQSGSGLY